MFNPSMAKHIHLEVQLCPSVRDTGYQLEITIYKVRPELAIELGNYRGYNYSIYSFHGDCNPICKSEASAQ